MYVVAITSGKGGAGKSCVAAYTGLALAEGGKKTLLVELGADARSLDIILGVREAAFDIEDVLAGRCGAEEAAAAAAENLFLLPARAGRYRPPDAGALETLLRALRREYDYILLDGVDPEVLPLGLLDTVLLVTTPDTLSVRACQVLARELYAAGAERLRLVINSVSSPVTPILGAEDFDDVIDLIGAQLIAVIPQSPRLCYSSNNSVAVDEQSVTVQVFDNLAARLRGQHRPLLIR